MSLSFEVWPTASYRDGAGASGEAVLRALLPGQGGDWWVRGPAEEDDGDLIIEMPPRWVATRSRGPRRDRLELCPAPGGGEGWHLSCASSILNDDPRWFLWVQCVAWVSASSAPFVVPFVVFSVFGRRLPWYAAFSIAVALTAVAMAGLWYVVFRRDQVASKARAAALHELAAQVLAIADASGRFGLRPRTP